MLALRGGIVAFSPSSLSSLCFSFSPSLIYFVLSHLQCPHVCLSLFICFSFPSSSSRSWSSDVYWDTISGGQLSHTHTHIHRDTETGGDFTLVTWPACLHSNPSKITQTHIQDSHSNNAHYMCAQTHTQTHNQNNQTHNVSQRKFTSRKLVLW